MNRSPLSIRVNTPPPNCLIGGDFNVRHPTFEPGAISAHRGAELERWAGTNNLDYIGTPGLATHRAGHVLDLTFSNIAFAATRIRYDMNCGSNHETQVTVIPAWGRPRLEQHHYQVLEAALEKFAGLVELGMIGALDPRCASSTDDIDACVESLTAALKTATETAGKPNRDAGHAAPALPATAGL